MFIETPLPKPGISEFTPKTSSSPFKTTSSLPSLQKSPPPKPPASDTIIYPPTSSSINISSPYHNAIDDHVTLDGPANQSINVTDVHDIPSDVTLDVQPINVNATVVHDTPSGPTKQSPIMHDAIPANQSTIATDVPDTHSDPSVPLQHDVLDATADGPDSPKQSSDAFVHSIDGPINHAVVVHDSSGGPIEQSPLQPDAPPFVTSTSPKDSSKSPSSSSSKPVPESNLSNLASKTPPSGQKLRANSSEKPKYTTSPESSDADTILVPDPRVHPFYCKYIPKPKKLPRFGRRKIFLDQNLDAGRMDIVGSCHFCGEKLSSCYTDFHNLTCRSFDQADVDSFYTKMARLSSRKDKHDIESVAINYCLYELETIHIADLNDVFDFKSIIILLLNLKRF